MMYVKLLIDYIKEKNRIIKEFTDIDYATEEDIKELEEWREEEVIKFFQYNVIERYCERNLIDADICPWCHKYKECDQCTYGKRHGICDISPSNIYKKIGDSLSNIGYSFIINIPEIEELTIKYLEKYKQKEKEKM